MTNPDLKRYTESNRAAWNEVMPLHQRASQTTLDGLFSQPGYIHLGENEISWLRRVGIQGKSVAHLCCNNGTELLSLKNMGAGECVGFDICDAAVEEAERRAAQCGIDCRFVRADVFDIDESFSNCFDLVYVSAGCFGWMPDLRLFFEKASALLKPGGIVFIHEIHPFTDMLPDANGPDAGSLRIVGSYFKSEPYQIQGGLDYVGKTEYAAAATQYWFVHPLSDVITGLIDTGFALQHFREYEQDISSAHHQVEEAHAGVPLSYILVARKLKFE